MLSLHFRSTSVMSPNCLNVIAGGVGQGWHQSHSGHRRARDNPQPPGPGESGGQEEVPLAHLQRLIGGVRTLHLPTKHGSHEEPGRLIFLPQGFSQLKVAQSHPHLLSGIFKQFCTEYMEYTPFHYSVLLRSDGVEHSVLLRSDGVERGTE